MEIKRKKHAATLFLNLSTQELKDRVENWKELEFTGFSFTEQNKKFFIYKDEKGNYCLIDEKNVKVSVADSGDGIDPQQAPNLFTSFTQVGDKSRVGRLGLGLSIAKDIVVNHGGRIWAHSEGLGKGASFNFTLPIMNS